jgi:hypothetical protein
MCKTGVMLIVFGVLSGGVLLLALMQLHLFTFRVGLIAILPVVFFLKWGRNCLRDDPDANNDDPI